MDKFLDRYQVTKLSQDQVNDLNSPISPKEIEGVINNLPKTKQNKQTNKQTNKKTGPDGFSAEFYQTFKEDLIPVLHKLFHKIEVLFLCWVFVWFRYQHNWLHRTNLVMFLPFLFCGIFWRE
jgi:hypothetical protein